MESTIILCREECGPILAEEIQARHGSASATALSLRVYPGYVRVDRPSDSQSNDWLQKTPYIFERQRLPDAQFIQSGPTRAMARTILSASLRPITLSNASWTIHAYAPDAECFLHRAKAAQGLASVFLNLCSERFSKVHGRYIPTGTGESPPQDLPAWVLQICAVKDGFFVSAAISSALSDNRPGGIHRMAFDSRAPSRSYLKIEEAFERMGVWPQKNQTVVDLGAAPGGWSWAFLKRDCCVTAVDNGPLKLPAPLPARATLNHIRHDGVTYTPSLDSIPVDWLVSDMLMAAGKNISMVRRWIDNRWMRRFVINIKLPQEHPYQSLLPLMEYLQSKKYLQFDIRHFYHDRREVTITGGQIAGPTLHIPVSPNHLWK